MERAVCWPSHITANSLLAMNDEELARYPISEQHDWAGLMAGSRPSSWWRFSTEAEAHGCGGLGAKSSAVGALQRSAIDGRADCAASGRPLSSPAPLAHRCAAAGLDSGPPAERWASMPFDGAVDRVKWARPRMG